MVEVAALQRDGLVEGDLSVGAEAGAGNLDYVALSGTIYGVLQGFTELSVETDGNLSTTHVLQLQLALEQELERPVALNVTVIPVRRLAPSLPVESRGPPPANLARTARDPTPCAWGLLIC